MKIKNIKELRDSLCDNYDKMLDGKMPIAKGKELANTAGKVMMSVKIEQDYLNMTKTTKKIEFLEY